MTFLAIRGATTCKNDSKQDITKATQELVTQMMDRNEISQNQVVSILFTSTADLTQEFPATAARGLGLDDVPLMCAQELSIIGSMPKCIRAMMHVDVPKSRSEIHHVFLGQAQSLRKDLSEEK